MRRIAAGVCAVLSISVGAFACGPLANDGVAPDGGGSGNGNDATSPPPPADDSGTPMNTPDTGGGGGNDAGAGADGTVNDANTPSDGQPPADTGPGVDSNPPPPSCTLVTSWASGAGISHTGWTATASATNPVDGTATDKVTANAFDDNLGTRWSNGQAQATANMDYFTVNLGSMQSISQVVLFNGSDAGANDFPAAYKVALSTDNTTFTTVATGTGSPQVSAICVPTQMAQYVQITETGTSGSWWSIYELQMFP
jgi:hypothetical protein